MPPQNQNNGGGITGIAPSAMPAAYFQGAPITKLGLIAFILSQFVFKQKASSHHNANHHSTAPPSPSTGQLFVATTFLVPHLRKLERELGSAKFCVWLLSTMLLSLSFIELFHVAIGDYLWAEMFVAGLGGDSPTTTPAALLHTLKTSYHFILIGGVLYWYYQFVPRLYPRFVSVLGTPFSEKALYGIWGIYVVFAGGVWSLLSSTLGAVSSALFLSAGLGTMLQMPDWIARNSTFDGLGGLFLLDPPTKIYAPLMMAMGGGGSMRNRGGGTGGAGAQNRGGGGNAAAAAAAVAAAAAMAGNNGAAMRRQPARTPSPPPQAAIDQLTAMGFEEQQVRQALQQSGNNVERAADRLLSG